MTHHPDQLAHLARLRHAQDVQAARRHVIADVLPAERRAPLGSLRRFLVRKPEPQPAYVREFRVA